MACGPDCGTAVREMEILEQMSQLRGATEVLHKALEDLESRITPAMRNEPNVQPIGMDAKDRPLCLLADSIRDSVRSIQGAKDKVDSFMRRLEM